MSSVSPLLGDGQVLVQESHGQDLASLKMGSGGTHRFRTHHQRRMCPRRWIRQRPQLPGPSTLPTTSGSSSVRSKSHHPTGSAKCRKVAVPKAGERPLTSTLVLKRQTETYSLLSSLREAVRSLRLERYPLVGMPTKRLRTRPNLTGLVSTRKWQALQNPQTESINGAASHLMST